MYSLDPTNAIRHLNFLIWLRIKGEPSDSSWMALSSVWRKKTELKQFAMCDVSG